MPALELSAVLGGLQVMFAAVFALSVNLLKLILFEIMDLMSVRCAMRDGLEKPCSAYGCLLDDMLLWFVFIGDQKQPVSGQRPHRAL